VVTTLATSKPSFYRRADQSETVRIAQPEYVDRAERHERGSKFACNGSVPLVPLSVVRMSRRPIVLLALVGLIGLVPSCKSKHENIVHVIAEQAPGLKKSARVQFRGVDIGLVKEVYFTPSGVRIDVLVQRPDVPIRTQDTVRIASAGVFGEQIIDIRPGNQSAPLITRGATLTKAQPESTVSLPVGAWRAIVKTLGIAADSVVADTTHMTAKPATAKP
jgi:hypothetical protein